MITDIIKQAREMLEKCSDGPWNAGDAEVWRHGDLMSVGICALNFKCENGDYTYFPNSKVHAEFIAFARNNFAAILDEVESCNLAGEKRTKELLEVIAENNRLKTSLIKLRDCDWEIMLPDRVDAVREIAHKALEEDK